MRKQRWRDLLWLLALCLVAFGSGAGLLRADDKHRMYLKDQQMERLVKAEESQAKALQEIAKYLRSKR